ncbi:amino acid adenylation domain-containing protein [Micromonospora sp. NPDC023633]|uniref:non-ribosomal peptide synthetase n=1 Tax=Micromonospora sp. NPDC023633 TaxID=3154320 RepID=UPI0033C48488
MTVLHPPSTTRLTDVVDCVADVLGRNPADIGPDQLLTEAGLESFSAVRLRRRLRDDLGVELPLTAFLDRATPRSIAGEVTAARSADQAAAGQDAPAEAVPAGGVPAATGQDDFPLTPIQTAYLVGRDPSFPLGGVATFFYFEYDRHPGDDPEQDVRRLETAWNRVVRRHPMLRMVVGPDARQRVLSEVPDYRIAVTDLRHADNVEGDLARLRDECSHQLLPVDRWPLFDLRATVLPDGRTRLHVGLDIIALDMTSWMVLMREWGRLTADPDLDLPLPAASFADLVSRRDDDPAEAARRHRDREYWALRLPTLPAGPTLPWARPVVELGLPHFTRHGSELTAPEWTALRRRAAARGLTSTAVLLAACALVLSRWGAAERFCLNTTLFDRPETPEFATVAGDFTTTVLSETPEVDPTGWTGFTDYATAVNRQFWTDLEHRSVSAVEALRERRTADLTPAYPVVFTSGIGLAGPGEPPTAWLGEEVFGVSQTPQVLIDHIVWDEGGRLRIAWDVVDGCLPDGYAGGMRDAHLRLLRRLADDEDIWADPALGWDPSFRPDERVEGSPFATAGPLLDGPLRRAASTAPQRAALLGTEPVSHGELADRAARTASALAGLGLRPGDLVAVALDREPAQIAATLGVTAAGLGYVPVEPSWPASRIGSVCAQAGIRHALVADGADIRWPDDVRAHPLDADGVLAGADPGRPRRPCANDLAYAIFTSGSTGQPKGVAVEHRQARTTLDEMAARFPLTPDDRVLALSAMSFDLSVYDVFGVLGAGAAMVLPDAARQRDPGHWLELAGRHRVTVWNSAPALLEMLVEYAEIDPASAATALAALRLVLLSGDWIPVTLPDRLRALAPRAQVVSLGGATEGSIWSICHPVDAVDPTWPSIPYGRALRGQSFHILDRDGRPCPVGVAGELYIGGDGVARGYVGDPEQTAHRFAHHPVLRRRVYRTGDLGRWRYDGTIEFLGRVDRQVKIRGHRIELGEIESVLDRTPGVRQCVARAVPGPDGRPRLVAYVVAADPGAPPDEDDLVARLREQLPEYMVPSRFLHLPALPVTDNGKVDHGALPDPYRTVRSAPADAAPPQVTADGDGPDAASSDGAVAPERPLVAANDPDVSLESLVVDAVRSGLTVRIEVGGGDLHAAAALTQAARIATAAARHPARPYALTAHVGAGAAVLALEVTLTSLAEPDAPPVAVTPDDLPDAAVEQAVTAVFGHLLHAPVDVDTPFFRLGATSLTLVLAHRRLVAELCPELAIVDLFAHPTVRELSRHITAGRPRAETVASGPATLPSPVPDPAPATSPEGPATDTRIGSGAGGPRPLNRRQARALAAEATR